MCRGSAPPEGTLPRLNGQLMPSGSISRSEQLSAGFTSATNAFAEAVMHAGASSGTASRSDRASEWACLDVNRTDPVEMALAADLQHAVLDHVVTKTCKTYDTG